jgi:hypothetical protein
MRKICAAVILAITVGYAQGVTKQPSRSDSCPPEYPFEYFDRLHWFQICLPAEIKRGVTDDPSYPKGATLFTGFVVPEKTNLEKKDLIIVSGDYDFLKSAGPFGQFTANGVTFKRAKFEDGAAGRLDLHVIYTPAGKNVHFDFVLHSVNVDNYDGAPNRPAEYNHAAQIKFTEQIMSTFRTL